MSNKNSQHCKHGLVTADGLIDSALQQQLLSLLTDDETSTVPPSARWEQRTVDDASNPHPSWGCRDEVLRSLKHQPAVMEVHARLARLYPDVEFHHMPADDMQVSTVYCTSTSFCTTWTRLLGLFAVSVRYLGTGKISAMVQS